MMQLVLPAFEHYALREISVHKVDRFIKTLAQTKSYSMAKQARTVLSLAFGMAVRYDAMRANPVRDTARLRKPPGQALSLNVEQIDRIRRAVRGWRREQGLPGPPPDGQLEDIIEVMLGTSARIGEVLAIRRSDVNPTTTPATVRLCGTIVSPTGKPTRRQPHPKTATSTRTVSVPSFTAEVLRARLSRIASSDPDHLIFFSRNGTPLTTNNVRRRLRAVLSDEGIDGVTPHSFRRTVATVLDRAGGADLAAEMRYLVAIGRPQQREPGGDGSVDLHRDPRRRHRAKSHWLSPNFRTSADPGAHRGRCGRAAIKAHPSGRTHRRALRPSRRRLCWCLRRVRTCRSRPRPASPLQERSRWESRRTARLHGRSRGPQSEFWAGLPMG
nr:tyrosine-type recombinase/integrase [uncultured Nocardioides sp.]